MGASLKISGEKEDLEKKKVSKQLFFESGVSDSLQSALLFSQPIFQPSSFSSFHSCSTIGSKENRAELARQLFGRGKASAPTECAKPNQESSTKPTNS